MKSVDIAAISAMIEAVAAAEVLPRWRNLAKADIVEKNGPDDLVTVADKAVEEILTDRLRVALPGSDVVGEEAVHANPTLLDRLRQPGLVWVIDPIDGTSNFARGEPVFSVMVALLRDGELVAGVLHAPALGHTTYAARGEGAWHRERGCPAVRLPRPPSVSGLADMVGIVGKRAFDDGRRADILARAGRFKALRGNSGCAGIDYPDLARGHIHVALYSKTEPWDHLPGLAIVAEQGFHYARHDGTPYAPGDNTGGLLVTSSAEHWQAVRDALLA